jgi:hypothetical protein
MLKNIKYSRRLTRFIAKRLRELDFESVVDHRKKRGRRWELSVILKTVLIGVMSGQRSLGELEQLSQELAFPIRKILGVNRRIPDTTARDILVKMDPNSIRSILHKTVAVAQRRKALMPTGLPFGTAAMDGKTTITNIKDDTYAQKLTDYVGETPSYKIRTVTSCLTSSAAKVCIDSNPIPANTNEKGFFQKAVNDLLKVYKTSFKMVTYDAGACSEANGRFMEKKDLYYCFGLKGDQPTLFGQAQQLLESLDEKTAQTEVETNESGKRVVRRIWITSDMAGFHNWNHLRTALRVQRLIYDRKSGKLISEENRYFISNAPTKVLSAGQWLTVVRRHWAVENNCHWTYDGIFLEDKRPWILEPNGMIVVAILRRIAYNLLALFRSVTQRSAEKRKTPWKKLIRELYLTILQITYDNLKPKKRQTEYLATV